MTIEQVQPKLIIHGGAGSSLHSKGGIESVRKSLYQVVEQVYALLIKGGSAKEAVVYGCRILEDDPRFNSGTGSVLQSDGQIRMSASLMDGDAQRFSGVINISHIKNPIDIAEYLQGSNDRVLSDHGASLLMRELNLAFHDPLTEVRLQEWIQERRGNFSHDMANVVAEPELAIDETAKQELADSEAGRGTIGIVAMDHQGRLAAGTSTGGKGFERIGRVSDSAMPAGNYANPNAAVSCTGIGEHIIDECLAARIVVRVTDGLSLAGAFARSLRESHDNKRDLGAIGIESDGSIAWGKTSEVLLAAYHNGETIGDTLELPIGLQTGSC